VKILYFSTVCENENYERIIAQSRIKPSVASRNYESSLIEGFCNIKDLELTVRCFPMIASFPGSRKIAWGARKENLKGKFSLTIQWLPTINIKILKQWSQGISSKFFIRSWLHKNKDYTDKCVLIYSAYEPISKNIVRICAKNKCKSVAIIPDLPRDMYANKKIGRIKGILTNLYIRSALKIQGRFDGYIYLTENMKKEINPDKPYVIMEGIADNLLFEEFAVNKMITDYEMNGHEIKNVVDMKTLNNDGSKTKCFTVMYAGALNEKYHIRELMEAIQIMNVNIELWLFGSGDFEEIIKSYAKKDARIKFFGRVDRKSVLKYEKEASLLINIRNPDDDFTKYSFPSKTIEYMASGTPLLTSRLKGIPEEYFDYIYSLDQFSSEAISDKIIEIANSQNYLEIGRKAKKFIRENKNSQVQAEKIIRFINEII
jgi:glycosyltransferase involved in cell wall biosynthesis